MNRGGQQRGETISGETKLELEKGRPAQTRQTGDRKIRLLFWSCFLLIIIAVSEDFRLNKPCDQHVWGGL